MKELSQCVVMVVDDTPSNVDLLVATLADYYDLTVATDGQSALELVEENPPDLILMDIMMPGLNGYDVCQRLKQDARFRDIPLIFITAKAGVTDERLGFEVGAVDYITKPISPPIVRARVKTHLTLRLAQLALEEQNRELLESARLKEDVDQIIRHDLKGPLTNILARPQIMMLDRQLKVDHVRSLESIRESGMRLLSMINMSLDLFKMERGLYHLEAQPLDLVGLARNLGAEWQSRAESEQVELELLVDGRPAAEGAVCRVMGEELLCYSMLSNLLKNALEASPRGGRVRLNIISDLPGLEVHNQGLVPLEIRDRFFEKYLSSGKHGGLGLGTYSARLMAETLGGSISMATSDQAGTTITVRFQPAPDWASSVAG